MNNLMKYKIPLIAGVIVLLVIFGGFFLMKGDTTKEENENTVTPTEVAIPTVDSSVKVALAYSVPGKEALLKVEGAPKGTTSIDYELSYQTAQQGLQGVIGTITPDEGSDVYEKELTIGTCSSGACVYHQVEGKVRLTLKFNGDYGAKIFEKEFEL